MLTTLDRCVARFLFRADAIVQQFGSKFSTIVPDIKLDFKDVLLRPKRSSLRSRSEVSLMNEITFLNSKQTFKGIPIIASNMDTIGTFQMAVALRKYNMFTTIHKYYSFDEWMLFHSQNSNCFSHLAASCGIGDQDFDKISRLLSAIQDLQYICIDVANGYSEYFVEFVRSVRASFPKHTIIAGNVVTGEMVDELLRNGADIVKIGIGPGSVCTTRKKTGIGYPQLSAIIECANAAHHLKGHIISDGGCTCPGDIAKAFGAGADFVMLGGMLAGHDQCGGETIKKNNVTYKLFYGMSSKTAMEKYSGGIADYRSTEGRTVEVPYKGDVELTILDILGGIRSTCTYLGATKLRELPSKATFIRCTQQLNTIFSS